MLTQLIVEVDSLHNLSYKEEFEGDTKRSTAAYKKVREDASIGSTYKLPLERGYARSLIKPVIMSGGNGKRLRPLSSKDKPKQFKKILSDLTLLQQTLNRNKFLGQPTVITPKKYESITKEQAAEIDVEIELITEPLQKKYCRLCHYYGIIG